MDRELLRNLIGLVALALVVAGVWGLWGWQWAAIAAGVPTAGFYLWGEIRLAQHSQSRDHIGDFE